MIEMDALTVALTEATRRAAKRLGCQLRNIRITFEDGFTSPAVSYDGVPAPPPEASWTWCVEYRYFRKDGRTARVICGVGDSVEDAIDNLHFNVQRDANG